MYNKALILLALLLLAPLHTLAQTGLNEDQLRQMMQMAAEVQVCMTNIDQSALKELERESSQVESDIAIACAAGERDQAMDIALGFAKKMLGNPDIEAIQKCTKLMEGVIDDLPQMPTLEDIDENERHVCDISSEEALFQQ